jgi:hypothetical protein
VGYMKDRYEYRGDAMGDVLPGVAYSGLRIGVKGSWLLGGVEPYASLEYRNVGPEGRFFDRFWGSGFVLGGAGALGVLARFGSISIRAGVSMVRYGWNLDSDPSSEYRADGALDTIYQVQLAAGFTY